MTSSNRDQTPSLAPPPGITPNFIDPPSGAYIVVITTVIFLLLTTPLVCLRVFIRHWINRRLWWDDYTSILAWIGLIGLSSILLLATNYGYGTDMWNVSLTHHERFIQLFANIEVVARISITFARVSILLLFLRIFVPDGSRKDKIWWSIWLCIWFNILYCIALVLAVTLQCVGQNKPPGSTCINTYFSLITASTINVISDLWIFIIPLVAVWKLQLAKKRKMGLYAVFFVGIIAVGTSFARLSWQIRGAKDPNQTLALMKAITLAGAEQATAIIVGCMPVLPALYRHMITSRAKPASYKKSPSDYWRSQHSERSGRKTNSFISRKIGPHHKNSTFYLLSHNDRDHNELTDMEKGYYKPSNPISSSHRKGTTTIIKGGCSESSFGDEATRNMKENEPPNVMPLVSKTVRVESHPIEGLDPISPSTAYKPKERYNGR